MYFWLVYVTTLMHECNFAMALFRTKFILLILDRALRIEVILILKYDHFTFERS